MSPLLMSLTAQPGREGRPSQMSASAFRYLSVSPAARIDPKVVEAAIGRSASLRQIYKQI